MTPAQKQANTDSFEYVWKKIHDTHWEAKPGGLDWQAVHDELRPAAAARVIRCIDCGRQGEVARHRPRLHGRRGGPVRQLGRLEHAAVPAAHVGAYRVRRLQELKDGRIRIGGCPDGVPDHDRAARCRAGRHRATRHAHPRGWHDAGHVRRPAALLLAGRHEGRRHHRQWRQRFFRRDCRRGRIDAEPLRCGARAELIREITVLTPDASRVTWRESIRLSGRHDPQAMGPS